MEQDRFRAGHGGGPDWARAVDACLDRLGPPDGAANLGFVYFTDNFAAHAGDILERLRAATGVELWTGTTGIGVCTAGREFFDEPAVVVMLAALPPDAFQIFAADDGQAPGDGYFAVAHCDPGNGNLPADLARIGEATGAYVVGGLTASRGAHPRIAGGLSEAAISGVLFSDRVPVVTGLTQGCSPIGPVHEVTVAEGNVIVMLDDRPAFDVFSDEIGEVLARDLSRVAGYIFAALPVFGVDRPDYLVRNITGLDPQLGLVAIGEQIETGQRVMFCRRDSQSAQDDLRRMLADLKARAGDATPKGAVYFSCLGRGPNMFGEDSAELRAVREVIGDVPLVGFFCNGEISNARLYTYTGVLSLFL